MTALAPRLTIADARRMVAAAMHHAEGLGVAVTACVVDAGGHLLAFERGDGAGFSTVEIVQLKARCSAGYGMKTGDAEAGAVHKPQLAALPNMIAFGGGIPVRVDGEVIGAVAVSGAQTHEDIACVEAALAAL